MHRRCWRAAGFQAPPFDIIVVWKLDRLARSTRDLLEATEIVRQAGGKFQSLSEPWADTTTHAGKLIMIIFAGIDAGDVAFKTPGVRG
jgi:DNA invertase Pin-like site-specific DNA recombinase